MLHSLYLTKEITKKVYNNLTCKMYIIFMISKISKTSEAHRLTLDIADKVSLQRNDKYLAFSILACNIYGKR